MGKSSIVCEVCGKDCSKYRWGGSSGHIWCGTCYKKQKKTSTASNTASVKQDEVKHSELTEKVISSAVNSNNEVVDMRKFIPITDGYIPRKICKTTDVKILETAYKNKDFVMIVGETGTGKTHLCRHFAFKKKLPYARISLNGGATADELIGHWIPSSDGKFKWQDGLLTLFVRNGGIVVLDEVNAVSPDILFCLHALTDDERTLTLLDKDSEVIHAHPNFFLITTLNPDYEGTKPLNEAFKDRFKVKLWFDYNAKIEEKLVEDKDILHLAEKLRLMKNKGEIATPISTRLLIYYKENCKTYGDNLALEIFLNNFEAYEREPIKNVLEMIAKGEEDKPTENVEMQPA